MNKKTYGEIGSTERGSAINAAMKEADFCFRRGTFEWASKFADELMNQPVALLAANSEGMSSEQDREQRRRFNQWFRDGETSEFWENATPQQIANAAWFAALNAPLQSADQQINELYEVVLPSDLSRDAFKGVVRAFLEGQSAENRGESGASTVKPIYQEESQGNPGMWSDVTPGYYAARLQGHFKGGPLRCLYAAPPSQAENRDVSEIEVIRNAERYYMARRMLIIDDDDLTKIDAALKQSGSRDE